MVLSALPPPPPTPITLMTARLRCGRFELQRDPGRPRDRSLSRSSGFAGLDLGPNVDAVDVPVSGLLRHLSPPWRRLESNTKSRCFVPFLGACTFFRFGLLASLTAGGSPPQLELPVEPLAHALLDAAGRSTVPDPEATLIPTPPGAEQHQPHAGGVHGTAHHVLEPADVGRHARAAPAPRRSPPPARHALQRRAAARQHHAGRDPLLEAGLGELLAGERQDLLGARLDDLAQDLARDLPRADARPRWAR